MEIEYVRYGIVVIIFLLTIFFSLNYNNEENIDKKSKKPCCNKNKPK